MIIIVDYGMGNLRSVEKAFQFLGFPARTGPEPEHIMQADGVVLPGVGAFGTAMENLKAKRLDVAVRVSIEQGKPFLGICLGLQLLFSESEEFGPVRGLGIFRGKVVRFSGPLFEEEKEPESEPRPRVHRGPAPAWDPLWEAPVEMLPEAGPRRQDLLKVPHMGWNSVRARREVPVLAGVPDGAMMYFVHGYHPVPEDGSIVATTTEYGTEFVSSISAGNLFACQFHPEKSHSMGLQILRNFGEKVYGISGRAGKGA